MDSVKEYVALVKAPWGRMLYELLFMQLNIPHTPKLKILDFGAGLGVTSNHYAAWHDVTAVEPNEEMIDNSFRRNPYVQIHGSIEKLTDIADNTYDIVLCHNVLEYIEEQEPVFAALFRMLKQGGTLSLVKHNRIGRVFHSAVFYNDPKKALTLLDQNTNGKSNYLGTQYIYSNDDVRAWSNKHGGRIRKILGVRAFWALGQNNTVKYDEEWYQNMLLLESRAAEIDEYKNAAFSNHLLIEKMRG